MAEINFEMLEAQIISQSSRILPGIQVSSQNSRILPSKPLDYEQYMYYCIANLLYKPLSRNTEEAIKRELRYINTHYQKDFEFIEFSSNGIVLKSRSGENKISFPEYETRRVLFEKVMFVGYHKL